MDDIKERLGLIQRLRNATQKAAATDYANVLPVAQDLPPLKSAGKTHPAMPNVVGEPLRGLLNVLSSFENPQQADERIVTDMINVFLAGRTGMSFGKAIKTPSYRQYKANLRDTKNNVAGLRVTTNDPNAPHEGTDAYFNLLGEALSDVYEKSIKPMLPDMKPRPSRSVSVPIKPREETNGRN